MTCFATIERDYIPEQFSKGIEIVESDELSTVWAPLLPTNLHDAAHRDAATCMQRVDTLDVPPLCS